MSPRPVIYSIAPGWSPLDGGQSVQIWGEGFDHVSEHDLVSDLKFGTAPASFHTISSSVIVATTPAQPKAGFYSVVVTDAYGLQSAPYDYFQYVPPPSPGSIRVLAPQWGQVFESGMTITIRWTTTIIRAVSHTVILSVQGRPPKVLSNRLTGAQRLFAFKAPSTAITLQAMVDVIAYDAVGRYLQGGSKPFTINPVALPKGREQKEPKEVIVDKEKERHEGPH